MYIKKIEHFMLGGAVALYLLFALYKIDAIPGEWFIDITIVHAYVLQILNGSWPLFFLTSAGPFYPYLVSPFVALFGESYLTYKILSIASGLIGIFGMYLFTKEASGSAKVGALSAIVTSMSFMYLIWSRLGNFNIIVPVLTAFMGYFVLKYIHTQKKWYLAGGIIVSSLGVITYPELFLMPPVFLILLAYGLFTKHKKDKPWKTLLFTTICFLPVIGLFSYIVSHDLENFTSGHIGSKIISKNAPLSETLGKFGHNLLKTAGMLHVQGDVVFRVNVSKSPHIDLYSGIFFLIGLVFLFFKKRKVAFYILVPLVAFALPGASPALPDIDMPNTARTLGTLPMTYVLVTFGLWAVFSFLKKRLTEQFAIAILCFLLIVIAALNFNMYFVAYANGLPYHNTPFGKVIASEIDKLPAETTIYITACCWGQWSQPEFAAMYYQLRDKAKQRYFRKAYELTDCRVIKGKHIYFVFNPDDSARIEKFKTCFPQGKVVTHEKNGLRIFTSMYLDRLP